MNAIVIDPHLITSHLEICSFLVIASIVDRCVVSNPSTFCYDEDTLITFCLYGYRLITFCTTMDISNLYGYYVNV